MSGEEACVAECSWGPWNWTPEDSRGVCVCVCVCTRACMEGHAVCSGSSEVTGPEAPPLCQGRLLCDPSPGQEGLEGSPSPGEDSMQPPSLLGTPATWGPLTRLPAWAAMLRPRAQPRPPCSEHQGLPRQRSAARRLVTRVRPRQRPTAKELLKHKFITRYTKKTSFLTELIDRYKRWRSEGHGEESSSEDSDM